MRTETDEPTEFLEFVGKKWMLGVQHTEPELAENGSRARKHHHLVMDVELCQDEYERYVDAERALQRFTNDGQLFALVMWDVQDYYRSLGRCWATLIEHGPMSMRRAMLHLRVNRYLLSFLSSMRTYLDYTETRMIREHGKDSESYQKFKQYTHEAYDGSFAYRFLYKLRNYAQHCGLPISDIAWGGQLIEDAPEKVRAHFRVGIDRDHILGSFDWQTLEEEIRANPPSIEINPLIDSVAQTLMDMHSRILADDLPFLRGSAAYMKSLIDRVSHLEGIPHVWEISCDGDRKALSFSRISEIPCDAVNAIIEGKLEDMPW